MKKVLGSMILFVLIVSLIIPAQYAGLAQDGTNTIFMPVVGRNLSAPPPPPPPPPTGWTEADRTAIAQIVSSAGSLEPSQSDKDEVSSETITRTINSELYWIGVQNHSKVQNTSDIMYLGANDDVIWPGALIKGDKAHDFVYTPITLPRAPLTLSVNLENVSCAGNLAREVADPNLSNIREGIRQLLQTARQGCDIVPAQAHWSRQEVYSEEHLNLALGANVNYSAVNLKTRFNWNDTTKRSRIIASYKQVFYEINMNTPPSPAALFDPTRTTVQQIGAAMPAGSDPMYVAGVKYGMMALMFFESSYSENNLKFAIDAAYEKKDLGAVVTGTLSAQQILQNSNINIVVYGGSTAGLETIYTGISGFNAVINASASGGPDSPGVPLAYKFRNVADNNLAMITFASNYSVTGPSRFPVYPRVRVALVSFKLDEAYNEDWPFELRLEMREMAIFVEAANCFSTGGCIGIHLPTDSIGKTDSGVFVLMAVGWKYPNPEDPNAYIDVVFNNRHDPYHWNNALLSVRASAVEDDLWPDPWDRAEVTRTFDTGPLIMEGATMNLDNRPERTRTLVLQDGNNFKFTVTYKFTLMNP